MNRRSAFTLIELLIVVAIIAILAAIAVPNFLEAQVRSQVSKVKADMRSAATALESYVVDNNQYPYDGYNYNGSGQHQYNYWYLPPELSTPVSYISSTYYEDPFRKHLTGAGHYQWDNIRYTCIESTWGLAYDGLQTGSAGVSSLFEAVMEEWGGWRLNSAGPDQSYGPSGWPGVSAYPDSATPQPYDPTNGTVSWGDIHRIGPE